MITVNPNCIEYITKWAWANWKPEWDSYLYLERGYLEANVESQSYKNRFYFVGLFVAGEVIKLIELKVQDFRVDNRSSIPLTPETIKVVEPSFIPKPTNHQRMEATLYMHKHGDEYTNEPK